MTILKCSKQECFLQKPKVLFLTPEANHGIETVIAEAQKYKEEGVSKTILFNLCGHGNFDMKAYDYYFDEK